MAEGIPNHYWLNSLDLNIVALHFQEFISLWFAVSNVQLTERDDSFRWNWESSGKFSPKSTYVANFGGREYMSGHDLIWHSKAPSKCKIFLWLAIRERCWTADRLQKRGLPHPSSCPFCDQAPETINHILLGCSFARELWHNLFSSWGEEQRTPSAISKLSAWWSDLQVSGKGAKT